MGRSTFFKCALIRTPAVLFVLLQAAAWACTPDCRVVSLSPFITETIYLLGAQDQLLADTIYCTVPPEASQKEKIGSVTRVNVEKIISLQPDLVISSPLNKQKQLGVIKSQGIRVMDIPNPKTFNQMCAITLQIAQALGRTGRGQALVKQASDDVAKICEQVSGLAPRRVFIQIGLKPLFTANKDLYINEFIVLANAVNIAENQPSGIYSREEVIRQDPDLILVATMGSNKKAGALEKERWFKFSCLTSAKNKEIYVLDPEVICHPTPISFAKGLKQVAALIHPEIGGPGAKN